MICNLSRAKRPERVFFASVFCFVVAVLTSLFWHPANDLSRGFVVGFTGVLFVAEIVFFLAYVVMQRRVAERN